MSEFKSQSDQPKLAELDVGSSGRRRFVRGVGVLVPAVLTVSSRSAMATATCLSPSASASINLLHSRPGRPGGDCANGRTPGYWKNAADNHRIFTARNKQFDAIYTGGFSGKTMEQVCKLGGGSVDPQELGAHLAAAWCNLSMDWVDASVISLEVLQRMWSEGNTGFHPRFPTLTPVWSREDVVTYLKTTMPL